jgi:hypothetical protein
VSFDGPDTLMGGFATVRITDVHAARTDGKLEP